MDIKLETLRDHLVICWRDFFTIDFYCKSGPFVIQNRYTSFAVQQDRKDLYWEAIGLLDKGIIRVHIRFSMETYIHLWFSRVGDRISCRLLWIRPCNHPLLFRLIGEYRHKDGLYPGETSCGIGLTVTRGPGVHWPSVLYCRFLETKQLFVRTKTCDEKRLQSKHKPFDSMRRAASLARNCSITYTWWVLFDL